MAVKFNSWTYNEIKTMLDQIGNKRYVSLPVLKTIARGLPMRTWKAVGVTHYLWNIYLGKTKHHKTPISKHLRAIFDAYRSANMELYPTVVVETTHASTDTSTIEQSLVSLEGAFEALKRSVEKVISAAVEEGVRNKTNEITHELVELRKFKEEVRNTSVFMKLRQTLTGR